MWLNKYYFIVMGLGVIFSNYPTFLLGLVAVQSFIDSHVVGRLCFFRVVGPKPAPLELHIIFFGVSKF